MLIKKEKPLKILFECKAITPGNSGGIENYVYMLVNGWCKVYPEDEVFLHISSKTKTAFSEKLNSQVKYFVDPVVNIVDRYFTTWPLKKVISLLSRINYIKSLLSGFRPAWVKKMDDQVDVVIYPFQRSLPVHDSSKAIFVMHDFRTWDLPGGNKHTLLLQKKAITQSAFVVASWPFPFKRLKEEFGELHSKFFQVPFLFDPMDNIVEKKEPQDFLYYPAGIGHHKNHINLLKALAIYNTSNAKKLRLICTGPENKVLKRELETLVQQLQIDKYIDFLGFVDRDKVFSLYQDCLAVITTTQYEAVSGAILEAFRFEKPVLASNIAAHTEFLKQFGIEIPLFDPNDPAEIAASIKFLVNHYEEIECLSKKGKESISHITETYTISLFRKLALKVKNAKQISTH